MGEQFYTVHFTESGKVRVGVLTNRRGGCYVIDPAKPEESFRGDVYERELRDAVIKDYAQKYNLTLPEVTAELNDGCEGVTVW